MFKRRRRNSRDDVYDECRTSRSPLLGGGVLGGFRCVAQSMVRASDTRRFSLLATVTDHLLLACVRLGVCDSQEIEAQSPRQSMPATQPNNQTNEQTS